MQEGEEVSESRHDRIAQGRGSVAEDALALRGRECSGDPGEGPVQEAAGHVLGDERLHRLVIADENLLLNRAPRAQARAQQGDVLGSVFPSD